MGPARTIIPLARFVLANSPALAAGFFVFARFNNMAPEPVKKTGGNLKGAGPGRPKGMPNKTTALLKDAILRAAEAAGGNEGMIGYLTTQAAENPGPFMSLLGKVLPMQVTGEDGGAVRIEVVKRVIVDPTGNPDG